MNMPVSYNHNDPDLGPSCATDEDWVLNVTERDILLAHAEDFETRVASCDTFTLLELHVGAMECAFVGPFLDSDERILDEARRTAIWYALGSADLSNVYVSERPDLIRMIPVYDPGPSSASPDDGL